MNEFTVRSIATREVYGVGNRKAEQMIRSLGINPDMPYAELILRLKIPQEIVDIVFEHGVDKVSRWIRYGQRVDTARARLEGDQP